MFIENIFPTPIAIIKVPNHFFKIGEFFNNVPHRPENPHKETYGTRSADSYILNRPEVEKFKEYITFNITEYSQKILNLASLEYRITQSWISFKHPQQQHIQHTHPNSVVSGVFYWELNDTSLPKINFHKAEVTNTFQLLPTHIKGEVKNQGFGDTASINIEPGMLVLFPSYLPHSVSINETKHVRKSLAFNSVPKFSFGEEGSLTELKL